MTVQVDFWQLLLALAALIACLGGALLAIGRFMLAQYEKHQDERFAIIQKEIAGLRELEQRFSDWHFEASEKFVRREDYIRGQTIIEAKLDALYSNVELVKIQGARSRD